MKGSRSIYQTLFTDDAAPAAERTFTLRRGRSEALKTAQNELIICRYYYFVKIKEKQYEKALEQLEQEIYLSQFTIIKIISRESAHLKMLQQAKPDIRYFEKKYGWINW